MKDKRKDIIDFWFEETQPKQWFEVNEEFDQQIIERFEETYKLGADGHFEDWKNGADGALAYCILLDQFPRNMYRGTPQAFATDSKALVASKYAVSKGLDQVLSTQKRWFLYMPFEHSENINDQRKSVELFEKMKGDNPVAYDYAVRHMEVIDKYGRFPHRNEILGRENTPEEEEYLSQDGAGF